MTPNQIELALMDEWQHGFPLVAAPFDIVGRSADLSQAETIGIFRSMQERGVISRIGAVVRPNTVGASVLAAMRVPPAELEAVAEIVSRHPLVTHNYERSHELNLWFVLSGASREGIEAAIRSIEVQTGLEVIDLPMLRSYYLGLGFSLQRTGSKRCAPAVSSSYSLQPLDRQILAAIEDGLPLVERPYHAVAETLGRHVVEVVASLRRLIAAGVVTRFGCVVRHDKLGYRANAMAVWDVPDEMVDSVASIYAQHPRVTLCYRRPRRPPHWSYNLFCMVHAKSHGDAYAVIDDLNLRADTGLNRQAVLFSTRCFKQRGAVYSDVRRVAQ